MKRKILINFLLMICLIFVGTKVNAAKAVNKVSLICPDTIYAYDNSKVAVPLYQDILGNTISPSDIKVSFSSSNSKVASISSTGKITAKKPGETKITVTVTQGMGKKSASKTIKVTAKLLSSYGAQNITETKKTLSTSGNPYYKSSSKTYCLNFNGYNGTSKKSNGTSYANGAVALYTIQGIRGLSPNANYLTSKTDANSTYFITNSGTNFKIIGYSYTQYSSYQNWLQKIYDEIIAGYPVAVKVYNSSNSEIYVVAYAVNATTVNKKGTRTSGKLSASDISVIDTSSGTWKRLSDFGEFKDTNGKYILGIHSTTTNTSASTRGTQVVNYAKKYLGYSGRQLGYNSAWCALFATKCYKECGVFTSGSASCNELIEIAKKNGCWKAKSSGYKPKAGDLIFYDYQGNGDSDHVEIIESYTSDTNFKIIGGNIGGKVKEYTRCNNGYHNQYIKSHIMGFYAISN